MLSSLLQNLRYISFWFIDFITGSKTKKHLQEIKFTLENYDTPNAKEKRENRLNEILKHAKTTTIFYGENKNLSNLEDFKIIDKNILRSNINAFISNKYVNKRLYQVSTSGSTGGTLTVFQDKNKKYRNTADIMYFAHLAGYKMGHKLFYARHWGGLHKKSKFKSWIQNITPIEVFNLSDDRIASIISILKKGKSKKGLLGYASAFDVICKYLDKTKSKSINANIESTIVMSESLNNYTKQAMLKYFGCLPVSRYSNTENGLLAQQTLKSNNDFIINWSSYYIEILELEKDIPVKQGEIGRIIVTDLFNYAMPLIRYDTGDLGIIDYTKTPPVLKKIEGRKNDIICNTSGDIVSSFVITNIAKYKNILQAQLIQENKDSYTLKLNVNDDFIEEFKIINEYKRFLGSDAKISVIYVSEIPLLSSGKRRSTINNYKVN